MHEAEEGEVRVMGEYCLPISVECVFQHKCLWFMNVSVPASACIYVYVRTQEVTVELIIA